MPNLQSINQSLIDMNISEKIRNKIMCVDPNSHTPEDVIKVIEKMDLCLERDQCLSIMEKEGCCKSGKRDKDCKKYAKENKDKTFSQKFNEISSIRHMDNPRLNADGTITTGVYWNENGVYRCACPAIKKLKEHRSISSTYCGCCAGHFKYHYQNILGVKLKLKEIVSSPLNSNGEKPCEFILQVIEE
jgi:hypothetical protein